MRTATSNSSKASGRRARAVLVVALSAAALLAGDTSPARAQDTLLIRSGSRVRITSPALRLHAATGTIQEATDDALLVQFDNPKRAARIERTAITEMDVSVGHHRKALKGAGMGLLVGGGGGALLGFMSGDDPPGTLIRFSAGDKAAVLGVLLGGTGAIIGLIAGALTQTDIWAPASPAHAPPVGLSLLPFAGERGTGFKVGVSLRLR